MSLTSLGKRKPQRALALLTAMLVCTFLFLLTGALIQTQSGVFAVAQSSDARVRSSAACQSLYSYCLYQIEHNRDWGRNGFPDLASVDPPRSSPGGLASLDSRVTIKGVSGTIFRGYLPEHGTGFQVEVVNALTNPAGASTATGGAAGPQQVRLHITAWEGDDPDGGSRSRQQVDCLLRLAPLYDSSVLSRGNVSVAADEVLFASKDPFRNEIRAEGDVFLPGLTDGKTRFVKHDQEVVKEDSPLSDMKADQTGMLWSGKSIRQENGVLTNNPESGPQLSDAARATGGRMVDKATSRADIYDLKPENIPQPSFDADHDITTPAGEFRFTKALATIRFEAKVDDDTPAGHHWEDRVKNESIDVLEYYDPPNSDSPTKVMRRDPKALDTDSEHFLGMDVNYGPGRDNGVPVVVGDKFSMDSKKYTGQVKVKDSKGNISYAQEMGFGNVDSGSPGPVTIDLARQTVTVASGTRVRPASRPAGSTQPPAAFELTVKKGPGGNPPSLPTFLLGSGANDVVIEADGNIAIGSGYTKGLGTIISKHGNVTLNPIAQELKWVEKYIGGIPVWVLEQEMSIEANSNYAGLVVYADKDVHIANISDADWGLRGFIYARGNFLFDLGNKNATFYGSVVAGNTPTNPGQFSITNGDRATFIYDPDYLKLLTKQLPNTWTRIESLVWSQANG